MVELIIRMFLACPINPRNGVLVQLVRIHACHAWGHGFKSHTHRKNGLIVQLARMPALHAGGPEFESQ